MFDKNYEHRVMILQFYYPYISSILLQYPPILLVLLYNGKVLKIQYIKLLEY